MFHDFEAWWLLSYPLVFGLGWLSARIDLHHLIDQARQCPHLIYKGLKSLIEGQQKDSIVFFTESLTLVPHNDELKGIIGSLLRQNGLFHQAIDLHRELLFTSHLTESEKNNIQYELARDFLEAGIHNEAEKTLLELAHSSLKKEAMSSLSLLYQRQKNWGKAIQWMGRCGPEQSPSTKLGHYHCESALQEQARGNYKKAINHLKQALIAYPGCSRAYILLARQALAQQPQEACQYCQHLEKINIHHVYLAISEIKQAYTALGQEKQLVQYWEYVYDKTQNPHILRELIMQYQQYYTTEIYSEKLSSLLMDTYSLVKQAILLQAITNTETSLDKEINTQKQHVYLEIQKWHTQHVCTYCGFNTHKHTWLCPICERWDTMHIQTID